MNNKLFCTLSERDELRECVDIICSNYDLIYGRIFVLESPDTDEYILTYNVDLVNVSYFIPNTILVHLKKHTRTLYTINALNSLIRELNYGVLDKTYKINWSNYRNSLLLTKNNELNTIRTKFFKKIEF